MTCLATWCVCCDCCTLPGNGRRAIRWVSCWKAWNQQMHTRCRPKSALRAYPLDIKEQYERQTKDRQEAYGEAMLELRARKKSQPLLGEHEK